MAASTADGELFDAVVLGAGIQGSCAAHHLASRRLKTLLLEQFPLPHTRGSSHGQSRVAHSAYPQDLYVALMAKAEQLWTRLEAESGTQLHRPMPVLVVGHPENAEFQSYRRAMERHHLPCEILTPQELARTFPGFRPYGGLGPFKEEEEEEEESEMKSLSAERPRKPTSKCRLELKGFYALRAGEEGATPTQQQFPSLLKGEDSNSHNPHTGDSSGGSLSSTRMKKLRKKRKRKKERKKERKKGIEGGREIRKRRKEGTKKEKKEKERKKEKEGQRKKGGKEERKKERGGRKKEKKEERKKGRKEGRKKEGRKEGEGYWTDLFLASPPPSKDLFQRQGGLLRDGEKVLQILPGSVLTITTSRGKYQAKRLVITAGAWTNQLLAPLGLQLPLQPLRVRVCYLQGMVPGPQGLLGYPPCFLGIGLNRDDQHFYGLQSGEYPDLIKVCYHHGSPTDPDKPNQEGGGVSPVPDLQRLQDFVSKYLPELDPEPAVQEWCLYTNTPDRDFILDRHPRFENIVIGAGFSGHGFKFGPVVGKILCELSLGEQPTYDLSPFRLGRFREPPKANL
ncbi:peroxisomal sarcosine oxidase [Erythrolamprus reginae]|uniref:peroxisomal sarcosine oxidase n=1 Tax=Erythrolamprus reginae TaxID=121349 RepID=UPI00396CEC7B